MKKPYNALNYIYICAHISSDINALQKFEVKNYVFIAYHILLTFHRYDNDIVLTSPFRAPQQMGHILDSTDHMRWQTFLQMKRHSQTENAASEMANGRSLILSGNTVVSVLLQVASASEALV